MGTELVRQIGRTKRIKVSPSLLDGASMTPTCNAGSVGCGSQYLARLFVHGSTKRQSFEARCGGNWMWRCLLGPYAWRCGSPESK